MTLADRYELIEPPIGEGSFGAVYLANDRKMPRQVAVKVLHKSFAADPKVSARFLRELVAACRVSHENVIQVLDVGDDPTHGLFYVMEFAEGVALEQRLTGRPIRWPILKVVSQQLAAALDSIHAAGIVHRDLKPRNIMLVERASQDDLVKVLDFGIAVIHDGDFGDDVELTGTRMVVGTPPYMSPEQTYMKSDRERLGLAVDGRSDLYALGVILYEMLTGGRPFTGDAHELALAHRHDAPADPRPLAAEDVPSGFADLVMRLLAKTPDERPASAQQVLATLRALTPGGQQVVSPRGVEQDVQDAATCIVDALSSPIQNAETVTARAVETEFFDATLDAAALDSVRPSRAPMMVAALVVALGVSWAFMGSQFGGEASRDQAGATNSTTTVPPGEASNHVVDQGAGKAPRSAHPAPGRIGASEVSLMVTSVPQGAEVLLDGVVVGTTPLATTLSTAKSAKHLLEIQKPDYRIQQIPIAVAPHLSGKALVFNETLEKERSRRRGTKAKAKAKAKVTPKPIKPKASGHKKNPLKGLNKHLSTKKTDPMEGL
ncbi:MAG: serine/threonine-protein kinase [Myxococcota bacterium]